MSELVVDVSNGRLPDDPVPVLWLPLGPCEKVIEDFCVHVNLFCSREHLDSWRYDAGSQPGEVLRLADVPALARKGWADIAASS